MAPRQHVDPGLFPPASNIINTTPGVLEVEKNWCKVKSSSESAVTRRDVIVHFKSYLLFLFSLKGPLFSPGLLAVTFDPFPGTSTLIINVNIH